MNRENTTTQGNINKTKGGLYKLINFFKHRLFVTGKHETIQKTSRLRFFDQDIRLTKLSQLGDPLEKLNKEIDFEIFRLLLETSFEKVAKGKGGRRLFDFVLMFNILILQRYYNLSDDQVEFQINDRISFMRFLNLSIADIIPDSKTIWNFK